MTGLTRAERNSHQTGDQWTGKKLPNHGDKQRAREIFNDLLRLGDDDDAFINRIAAAIEGARRNERERCVGLVWRLCQDTFTAEHIVEAIRSCGSD